jgi:hypothetical protein
MIFLKSYEMKSGKPTIFSKMGKSIDQSLSSIYAEGRRVIMYFNRKTFVAIIQILAYHILLRVRKVYVEIKHRALLNPHGKKMIDAVRGRGEIRHHGASFYLRRISDK